MAGYFNRFMELGDMIGYKSYDFCRLKYGTPYTRTRNTTLYQFSFFIELTEFQVQWWFKNDWSAWEYVRSEGCIK